MAVMGPFAFSGFTVITKDFVLPALEKESKKARL